MKAEGLDRINVANNPINRIDPFGLYDDSDYILDAILGDSSHSDYGDYAGKWDQAFEDVAKPAIETTLAADAAILGAAVGADALPAAYTSFMAAAGTAEGQAALNFANATLWDIYGTGQPGYYYLMEKIWELLTDFSPQHQESPCE